MKVSEKRGTPRVFSRGVPLFSLHCGGLWSGLVLRVRIVVLMGTCWPRLCPVRVAAVMVVAVLVSAREGGPRDSYESDSCQKGDEFLHNR